MLRGRTSVVRRFLAPRLAGVRASHGFHSGAILAAATLVLNGAGYLYNLVCIRFLGPSTYGDVAALIALAALVSLPLGSVQYLLAREVAFLQTRTLAPEIRRLVRRSLRFAFPASIAALAVGLAFARPLADAFKVESAVTVAAGLSGIVVAVVATILYGFLQGAQRFGALALSYAASGLARPLLVVPALLVGLGAAGALAVNTVAGIAALAIAGYALRDFLRGEIARETELLDRREVAVMIAGSLAFVSLTNSDVLLASYFLSDESAGVYAAAAFVGKFVLFLPSAVVTVLLPKAASRIAAGETSQRILFASAAVTAALTLTSAVILTFAPEELLVRAFGPGFGESADLLGWFGLAMATAAVTNVYLSVYFAERDVRFPLLLIAAAIAQLAASVAWHPAPRAFVMITFFCFAAVLVIHEIAFPHALRAAGTSGLRGAPIGRVPTPVPPESAVDASALRHDAVPVEGDPVDRGSRLQDPDVPRGDS
jgi:O-antigen/teichoic acid export membrane protein